MKKIGLLTILLLSLLITNFAYAYPPDNAAVIYYKLMADFEKPDNTIWDQITEVARGKSKTEVNKQVQKYLESKHTLIETLETASDVPNCDWGLDFSQGFALQIPHASKMRSFGYIILANAQLKIQQHEYQQALNLCLTNIRMSGHVGNDTTITYLVGTAMTALSYNVIGHVFNAMPPNEQVLAELQRELELPEYNILNIKTALQGECRVLSNEIMAMTEEKKDFLRHAEDYDKNKEELSMLIDGNPEFLIASADYYQRFFDKFIATLDQPYKQAVVILEELVATPEKDYKSGNKEAFATVYFTPAIIKMYDIDIRRRTHQNAISTAIQLYRYYVENGTLLEQLPVTFPKDLFSGQSFEYEKTDNSFILRCRQSDLGDRTFEYSFKIAK